MRDCRMRAAGSARSELHDLTRAPCWALVVMYVRSPCSAHGDELELDVVGVSEHDDGVAALIVDRGVLDTEVGESCLPDVELGPAGHEEADVVEPGAGFGERFVLVGGVGVQPDARR